MVFIAGGISGLYRDTPQAANFPRVPANGWGLSGMAPETPCEVLTGSAPTRPCP
jgi:hypothetical protein